MAHEKSESPVVDETVVSAAKRRSAGKASKKARAKK